MMRRSRVTYLVIALAGLASVSACGGQPATTTDTVAVPVAVTGTGEARSAVNGTGEARSAVNGTGEARSAQQPAKPPTTAPAPSPTVAKIQKWVKIYSGPSVRNINPPRSTKRGSHTVELNATPSAEIGTYVTDGAGRTLYRFDNDSARPPRSTCNNDCATAWPPLLIKSPGKIYPKGINPKILGYVERADHTCQVTINGHPVYYFVTDSRPGDINGQGVNGTWFAVSPTGGRTRPLPDSLATPSNPGK
jgi:predicted lipoprotein with Yx(FWY)xxD motif